jgi:hypothetical protein
VADPRKKRKTLSTWAAAVSAYDLAVKLRTSAEAQSASAAERVAQARAVEMALE